MKNRAVENWNCAAEDAYTRLTERKRDYPKARMLALVDDLCLRGVATQAEMIEAHGLADLIATTLGHVTTAVHGPGAVLREGGWYRSTSNPTGYEVNPLFRQGWIEKRRLSRKNESAGTSAD